MNTKILMEAILAVRQAAILCQNVRAELVTADTLTKKDKSPVTIADLGAQALMSLALHGSYPDIPLMAEETADALHDPANAGLKRKVLEHVARVRPELGEAEVLSAIDRGRHPGGPAGRFWTLDPIDGTKGFIRNDQYAIALALIENGHLELGVMGCPSLPAGPGCPAGVIFAAQHGSGACVMSIRDEDTARPIHASRVSDPSELIICQSVESGHTSHGRAARIAARLGTAMPSIHLDSQCKYGIVARGDAGLYMRLPAKNSTYEEMIWDHAAGALIVAEAGGLVTDINGKALDFSLGRTLRSNIGVIATNGILHDTVIAAVQAVLQEG